MTFFAYFGRNPDQVASFSHARAAEEMNGTLANIYFLDNLPLDLTFTK